MIPYMLGAITGMSIVMAILSFFEGDVLMGGTMAVLGILSLILGMKKTD